MNKYELGKQIGKGTFGSVYLVKRKKDGHAFVLKRMKLGNVGTKERKMVQLEVQLLERLQHPSIVQYIESFLDKPKGKDPDMCVIMEHCEGGDMTKFIKSKRGHHMGESEVLDIFCEILLSLEFVHERNIMHRDLKAQNIFIKEKRIKIGDFGISKVLEGSMGFAETVIGTPYYMSPELFKNRPYGLKSD
eukprot:897856_1